MRDFVAHDDNNVPPYFAPVFDGSHANVMQPVVGLVRVTTVPSGQ